MVAQNLQALPIAVAQNLQASHIAVTPFLRQNVMTFLVSPQFVTLKQSHAKSKGITSCGDAVFEAPLASPQNLTPFLASP